jgi:tRNA modification GTPase
MTANTATGLSARPLPQIRDTIVALSTAAGPCARAIVRLTGPDAWRIIRACVPEAPAELSRWRGAAFLPRVHSPLPVELLGFAAPHSYTGQDLVEIHSLSSPPLVDALLAHLIERGARAAGPGEFTMRAFLAGKMDLTQAEAVHAVIAAETPDDLRTALLQLAGGMARPLHDLRDSLLAALAEIEAGLDFAEEDLTFIHPDELRGCLACARETLEALERQLAERSISGRPYRVVLAGLPNAGKSSLFNALGGRSLALVSPEAGTTRDYLVQRIKIADVELELIDTAGHETLAAGESPAGVKAQAQALRRAQIAGGDLVLWCFDVTKQENAIPDALRAAGSAAFIAVATKCDLLHPASMGERLVQTSAVTGLGLDELFSLLGRQAREVQRSSATAGRWSRCASLIRIALDHLRQAENHAAQGQFPELLALELRSALDNIGEMVGAVYTDDLLDRIFSQFCIGK